MYSKIADYVNDQLGYNEDGVPLEAQDVEDYLRYGASPYVDVHEANAIEDALEKFL